jgi:O-antigen/teichoic acid export membrane protein
LSQGDELDLCESTPSLAVAGEARVPTPLLSRPGGTLQGHSKERYRRAAWTGLTSVIARGASLLSALASVPLTIGYLGTQRFALWMTINSLMAMLMFADLGLGNGLLTAISESHGKDDLAMARKYISSAFFMLSSIGISILLVLGLVYKITPWARFLGVRPGAAWQEAAPAAALFFICFACNLPLGIVQRIQMGFQSGYTSNAWNGLGALLGFIGVIICVLAKAGVPWLVLSVGVGPIIATILNGIQLFHSQPGLRPKWKDFRWHLLKQLLAVGSGFLILQSALAMAVGSDNFVIAHLFGPDSVAEYSVAMRIFTVVPVLLSMLIIPLWPAYGESVARGDISWAIRAFKRAMVVTTGVTLVAAIFLTLSARWIIALWVGDRFHQSPWLLSGMGLWMVVNALAIVVSVFLNGINRIRVQAVSAIAIAVSTLAMELLAGPKLGLPAIIWSTDISYICFALIPIAIFLPGLLKRLELNGRSPSQVPSPEPDLVIG